MAATVDCDTANCSVHTKKCLFYCYECEKLICYLCLNSGEHKLHNFNQLSVSFYAQQQANMQQLVHDILETEVATKDSLLLAEGKDKATNKRFLSMCNDIEIFFQQVSEVIDAKERDLKGSLAKEKAHRTQQLQGIKRDYEDAEKQCRQCKQSVDEGSLYTRLRAKEASSVADSICVLGTIAEVARKVKSLFSFPLPSADNLDIADIDFNADEAIVDIAISKLGHLLPGLVGTQPVVAEPAIPDHNSSPSTFVIDSPDSDSTFYHIPESIGVRGCCNKKDRSPLSVIKGIIKHPNRIIPFTTDDKSEPSGVCCTRNNGVAASNATFACLQVFNLNGDLVRTVKGKFNSHMKLAYYRTKQKMVCIDCDQDGKCQLVKIKSSIALEMETYELSGISHPGGVTVGIDESNQPALFVTDSWQSVIYKVDTHGNNLQRLMDNDGLLAKPMGIAYTHGCIVVCDYGNNSIVKLSTVDGRVQWKVDQVAKSHCLAKPFDVAIDHQGYIYVTESGGHRVSVFNHKGKFMTHFGRKGSTPGMFQTPSGITMTEDDSMIVVADSGNNRLQVFSRNSILEDI